MADLTFNVEALDQASQVFIGMSNHLERLSQRLNALDQENANPQVDVDTAPAENSLQRLLGRIPGIGGEIASSLAGGVSGAGAAMGIAGAALGGALVVGLMGAMDAQAATARLQVQLGATSQEAANYGRIAGELYTSNFGGSLDEVNTAIVGVTQNLGSAFVGTDAQLKDTTATVLSLADAFGVDVTQSTIAVGALLRNGLAPDAATALDVITAGFQSGVNKSDDFLETLNEYSPQFAKFGLSAADATGLMSQGLQGGARDADTVADAIKEFSIRAVDGSKASAEGFAALGLSAADMTAMFARGGPEARAGLDTVLDGLRNMEDPVARNAAGVQLFGTKWEDMGASMLSLDLTTAVDGLGQVAGAGERMNDTLGATASGNLESFKRQISVAFVDVVGGQVLPIVTNIATFLSAGFGPALDAAGSIAANVVVPAFMALAGWLQQNAEWLLPLATTIGVLAIAMNASAIAAGIWAAATAIGTAVSSGAAAAVFNLQGVIWLMNAAFAANPIGVVIVVLAALVAGLVVAYNTSETFRNIIDGAFAAVGAAIQGVIGWFANFPANVASAFGAVGSFFAALPGQIVYALGFLAGALFTTAVNAWNSFTTGVTSAFVNTVAFLTGLPGQILAVLVSLPSTLAGAGTSAIGGFGSGISAGWEAVAAFFVGLPGVIVGFFAAAPSFLLTVGTDIINGLITGLTGAGQSVVDWFSGLITTFVDGFKAGLGIASPSTVFYQIALDILQGLLDGLAALGGVVLGFLTTLGDNIIAAFTASVSFLTNLWTSFWTGLQAVASAVFGAVVDAIGAVWSFIANLFGINTAAIGAAWSGFWNTLSAVATTLFAIIQAMVQAVWAIVVGLFTGNMALLQAGWDLFWNALSAIANIVFAGIQALINTVWSGIVAVFSATQGIVSAGWDAFWNLLRTVGETVFNAIRGIIEVVWSVVQAVFQAGVNFVRFLWDSFWEGLRIVTDVVFNAIRAIVEFVWSVVQTVFQVGVDFVRFLWDSFWTGLRIVTETIFNAIRATIEFVWSVISGAFSNAIAFVSNAWQGFWNLLSSVATTLMSSIQGGIQGGLDAVGRSFEAAVGFIGRVWQGIKAATRDPIQAMVDVVYNNGVVRVWNFVAKLVGMGELGTYTLPGFRDGGPVTMGGGKGRDDVLARLSRNEHVITDDEVDGAGGHGNVFSLRRMMRDGSVRSMLDSGTIVEGADHDGPGSVRSGFGGVQPHVAQAGHYLRRRFGIGVVGGIGQRANASDHPKGLALDFMTRGENGTALSNHLFANWDHFATKYVIWKQRIANRPNAWRGMANRGGDTANHFDHVHVSFTGTPGVGAEGGAGGAPPFDPVAWLIGQVGDITGIADKLPRGTPWLDAAFGMGGKMAKSAWDFAVSKVAGIGDMIGGAVSGAIGTVGNWLGLTGGPARDAVRGVANGYGWGGGDQWNSLARLIQKESSWNPQAQNKTSTAYGLFQFLNSTWATVGARKTSDPAGQAVAGLKYIRSKYGDPVGALRFHDRNNWYANGGRIDTPTFGLIGEAGPEVVLPLNRPERTAQLMSENGLDGGGGFHVHVTTQSGAPAERVIGIAMHEARVRKLGGGRYARAR